MKRVFVANRGEIAVRIVRACRDLGLESVVGCSDVDRDGLAARSADRSVVIGPGPASQSYLRDDVVVRVGAVRGGGPGARRAGQSQDQRGIRRAAGVHVTNRPAAGRRGWAG